MIAIAPIKSLPDGSVATIPMSWADYQQLAASRGDRSTPRLKYADGYLTLKMPTFEHGQLDAIVADLIVALLNQQLRDYVRTTPVTLQIPEQAGIEPGHCFWLSNWAAVSGKSHIDLATDPPPDIAVEVDVTNFTNITDYERFKVPEVWLNRKNNRYRPIRHSFDRFDRSHALDESRREPGQVAFQVEIPWQGGQMSVVLMCQMLRYWPAC